MVHPLIIPGLYVIVLAVIISIGIKVCRSLKKNPNRKTHDFTNLSLEPGDFIVSWGRGPVAWLIRSLIWLKDGAKNPPTHNMHACKNGKLASAEAPGYKIVKADDRLKKTKRFMVFRFTDLDDAKLQQIVDKTSEFLGKGYDYYLYIIGFFRIMMLFVPLFYAFQGHNIKNILALTAVLILIYIPLIRILKALEKKSFACSEIETEIYKAAGILKTRTDATNISPGNNLDILLNMNDCKLVFDSETK